ncbi:MAG: RNA 3'-terminal phosphate cyclase [Candidatus Loosdrechtia sp.]|uniref:RNA 3'-terminal phosphate cyclase n=1 Tax=Candidatus Loosdrechtia sp. TaxID=3101272 RepID=UPI003A6A0B0C|nr:MAG: RNA 3'-terminal phosphate cyclase [Candidatus Jettenia sp. AMX2]
MQQEDIIRIDGSFGEGGGQILRTSLSLSAITKKPFTIDNIRANRKVPGLSYQHLQAVNATARVCNAKVIGNALRSTGIKFYPENTQAGVYHFSIGTAGSVSLVLQTLFYPLSLASKPSSVTITGGTHVSHSPCTDYLDLQWLCYLKQIGFHAEMQTIKAGFYPLGNGEINTIIYPSGHRHPLQIHDRGKLLRVTGISMVSNLDMDIARRQQLQAQKRLSAYGIQHEISLVEMPSVGKGTMLLLIGKFEHSQCCYFSLGAPGKRAEVVADEACSEFFSFLNSNGVVDEYLTDQLIIPLALTKGTSFFKTPRITRHLLTHIEIIKLFLPVTINISGNLNEEGSVEIHRL